MRAAPVTGIGVPLHERTGLDQAHARQSYLGRETVDRLRVAESDAQRHRHNPNDCNHDECYPPAHLGQYLLSSSLSLWKRPRGETKVWSKSGDILSPILS
jgi:hypothetical protein